MMRIWDLKNEKNLNSAKYNIVNKYENKWIVHSDRKYSYKRTKGKEKRNSKWFAAVFISVAFIVVNGEYTE